MKNIVQRHFMIVVKCLWSVSLALGSIGWKQLQPVQQDRRELLSCVGSSLLSISLCPLVLNFCEVMIQDRTVID